MALKTRNKRTAEFSMASMSDLVFLLLIFFMLTSTLVSPSAVKLFLPSSASKTLATPKISVYINEDLQYAVNKAEQMLTLEMLPMELKKALAGSSEATVVLRADKTVPVQNIVSVIDVLNTLNGELNTKHKLILATTPK